MPARLSAGPRPSPAQSPETRLRSHHVAPSLSGLLGAASVSMAFDAAVSFVNARVSMAKVRSAAESLADCARAVRSGTDAGTCSRHTIQVKAGDQVSGS